MVSFSCLVCVIQQSVVSRQLQTKLKIRYNKAFKRDACRVAFLVCGDFCGESGVRKLGLGGTHPLTQRYA
ncbi:DUF3265 domain-containing protein [Vibrio vulnificus]|nr:DUF3265 domain-containing protein [Vibrio vulnificus]